jgi:uncharacterized membrane protein YhaH (DUF805 family)
MNYYLKAFKNMTDFAGRANNSEFWYFVLFNILFSVAVMLTESISGLDSFLFKSGSISKIYSLIVFIPGLALTVRRLHDTGKSGSYIFLVLIPIIGIIILLLLLTEDGYPGMNKYGENQKKMNIGTLK